MSNYSFIPSITDDDVRQAAQLIQRAYATDDPNNRLQPDEQRKLQEELFNVQKRQEAWGLVVPFLNHPDPNVQFFGAHTAQVKIARDWSQFPQEYALQLRDMLIDLTGRAIANGRSKIILRKLFVAICSLALKIVPQSSSQWPDWLVSTVQGLSSLGATPEHLLDFLAIVAEEIETADLLAPKKSAMQETLSGAVPMVVQAITACMARGRPHPSPSELRSAMKCFEAWLGIFTGNDLTPFIPHLISFLNPVNQGTPFDFDEDEFVLASEALQEIMAKSVLSSGAGTKTLTEPLLVWFDRYGSLIVDQTVSSGFVDGVSTSFCKLLSALGDHSTQYLASNLASTVKCSPNIPNIPSSANSPTRAHLSQKFLQLLMSYTALPGYYGIDEEESETTLGFWYLFQEALWSYDAALENQDAPSEVIEQAEKDQFTVAKAVYTELVKVLGRKVTWPPRNALNSWAADQRDKFQTYRRDIGDTLINAYYVLRDNMLAHYVNDLLAKLPTMQGNAQWEDIEGTLHCLVAISEAIPAEPNEYISKIFGPDILGRLPNTGHDRVRRTAVVLIGSFSSWFTTQPVQLPGSSAPSLLMSALGYVVSALPEPLLCLTAANALRDLCDANRLALAPHISAFGELHANIPNIPDTEKSKVLQSIASVIQALPPAEEIAPVEAILAPIVAKLFDALQSSTFLPDEARAVAIEQLLTITSVAQGLTRTAESLLIFDDSPASLEEAERMKLAREDPRVLRLREGILDAIRRTVDLWSTDASISDALSELYKAITALPPDVTLLSLPAGPLLELICQAAQRQLTAVWLSLASMLILQLDPPDLLPVLFKTMPTNEADAIVLNVLAVLLQTALEMFSQAGAMESNPDIVQAFFQSMDTIAQHFVAVFYRLPPDLFNALMQCAVSALSLQERYSMVAACTFLLSLINRTAAVDDLAEAKTILIQTHGRSIVQSILSGFVATAPRSTTPNLIELLSVVINKYPLESKAWMTDILNSADFTPSKATPEAKEKFMKTIFNTRSMRRIRDAAQQFTLVARGLEGSSFGYASVTM